ncbi:hypothetical protein BGZ63DRAFT_391543 [Mariannaea sp. PMI_226]|nr:hypothetical protein BGZ63DRAFT_391543 [Mariannaea sp. PMI_226]
MLCNAMASARNPMCVRRIEHDWKWLGSRMEVRFPPFPPSTSRIHVLFITNATLR